MNIVDLTSIMNAADEQSALLQECNTSSIDDIDIPEGISVESNEIEEIPDSVPIGDPSFIKPNFNSMLNDMMNNPDEITKFMSDSSGQKNSDMMEQARKIAMSGQGEEIIQEMQNRGLDPKAMRSQMLEHQNSLRGISTKSLELTKKVILITVSRKIKVRNIPLNSVSQSAENILHTSEPVELSCSRLARGPLKDAIIKVWYNPNHPGVNRRASKIIGFNIGGEILIVNNEGDISEDQFLTAEKHITQH